MNQFCSYHIEYRGRGKTESRVKEYRATNAGSAFAKAHKEFPDAELLGGWRQSEGERGNKGEFAVTRYTAPSTAKVEPLPAVRAEELTFDFFEDCYGLRPFTTARDQAALLRCQNKQAA
jgi:hypothetical protein